MWIPENTKSDITQHQKAVHEGKKYPCRKCDHLANRKSSITQHQQVITEGKKYHCRECEYQAEYHLQRVLSLNTSKQYIKARITHAGNENTRQLLRVISLDTSKPYMRARNVTTWQLERLIDFDKKNEYPSNWSKCPETSNKSITIFYQLWPLSTLSPCTIFRDDQYTLGCPILLKIL